MTDAMKKFLEEVSQDRELCEKMNALETPEEIIALAAEKGLTVTEEDLKPDTSAVKLSDDEMEAVAGGGKPNVCVCVAGGGGESDIPSAVCACVGPGLGRGYGNGIRCYCVVFGAGTVS